MRYETQAQIEADLAYWQDALRLRDWQITLRLRSETDMPDRWGCVYPHWNNKSALLDVTEPAGWYRNAWGERDMEEVLVHELLHLHTLPIVRLLAPDREGSCEPEEQCINFVAEALVKLRRQSFKPASADGILSTVGVTTEQRQTGVDALNGKSAVPV